MPYSMTGFGRASAQKGGREMVIELKSVNHRYLDLNTHLPRSMSFLEDVIRTACNARLARGHVDVYISYRNLRGDARSVRVDEAVLAAYLDGIHHAAALCELKNNVTLLDILRFPNVMSVEEAEEDCETVTELCTETIGAALDVLQDMRAREGEILAKDIVMRLDVLRILARKIKARAPLVVEEYRIKLNERIGQMLAQNAAPDEARLATEVALLSDRASIDEELVRLDSHFSQMAALMKNLSPAGRKLDFLVQEMNRECNTIGSKAADLEIVNHIIEAKAEVEKIREQVQNIE